MLDNLSQYAYCEPMPKIYRVHDVISLLRERQGDRTQKEVAEEAGITPQYLGDVLSGKRAPGPSVLNYLGLETAFVQSKERAA